MNILRWPNAEPELPPDVVEALGRALGEALAARYLRDASAGWTVGGDSTLTRDHKEECDAD